MVLKFRTPTALDFTCLLVPPVGYPEFKLFVACMAAYIIVRVVLFDMLS